MAGVYAIVGDSRSRGRGQDGQDEERRGIVAVATMERAPAGDQAQSHVRGRFLAFFGADDQGLTPGVAEDHREAGKVDRRAPAHAAQGAPERHHKSPGAAREAATTWTVQVLLLLASAGEQVPVRVAHPGRRKGGVQHDLDHAPVSPRSELCAAQEDETFGYGYGKRHLLRHASREDQGLILGHGVREVRLYKPRGQLARHRAAIWRRCRAWTLHPILAFSLRASRLVCHRYGPEGQMLPYLLEGPLHLMVLGGS